MRTEADALWGAALALSLLTLLIALPVRWLRWPAMALAALATGGFLAHGARVRRHVPDALGTFAAADAPRTVTLRGVVEPNVRGGPDDARMQAGLRVSAVREGSRWRSYAGRAWWSWYEPDGPLVPGTAVEVRGRLRRARGFLNPGLFRYGEYLRARGYHSQFSARGGAAVTRLGTGPLPPGQAALAVIRRHFRDTLAQVPASRDGRAFLLAVLAGDRGWLTPGMRAASEATGTYHLLSISGLHVGIVASAVLLLGQGARLRRWTATATTVACLVAYAAVTGGAVPVVRATLMLGLAIVLLRLRRPPDGVSILSVAAAAVAFMDPLAFRAAGTQLSFAAVAALLMVYPPAARRLDALVQRHVQLRYRTPARWLGHALLVPTIVQFAIAPVLLAHSLRVPFIGIVANTIATPLLGAVLLSGAVAVLALSVHPWLGALPAAVAAGATETLLAWIKGLARLAEAGPALTAFPGHSTLLLYAVLLAATWVVLRRRPRWRVGVPVAWLAVLVVGPTGFTPRGLHITALDVGQADATLIRFPTGQTMLVDGGARLRSFDAGKYIVVPYLRRHGVRRLDWVVATHAHNDHMGGLITVLERVPVGEVWTNGREYDSWTARRFRAVAAEVVPVVRAVSAGEELWVGDALVRVLHPAASGAGPERLRENNAGVALRIDYGGVAVLLPADNGHSLDDLVAAGAPWPERVLVKAAHHGYPGGNVHEAIAGLRPLVAWASMGISWSARMPPPGLRGAQSAWRTDRHGALRIRVRPDGAVRIQPTAGQARTWPALEGGPLRSAVAGPAKPHL